MNQTLRIRFESFYRHFILYILRAVLLDRIVVIFDTKVGSVGLRVGGSRDGFQGHCRY